MRYTCCYHTYTSYRWLLSFLSFHYSLLYLNSSSKWPLAEIVNNFNFCCCHCVVVAISRNCIRKNNIEKSFVHVNKNIVALTPFNYVFFRWRNRPFRILLLQFWPRHGRCVVVTTQNHNYVSKILTTPNHCLTAVNQQVTRVCDWHQWTTYLPCAGLVPELFII